MRKAGLVISFVLLLAIPSANAEDGSSDEAVFICTFDFTTTCSTGYASQNRIQNAPIVATSKEDALKKIKDAYPPTRNGDITCSFSTGGAACFDKRESLKKAEISPRKIREALSSCQKDVLRDAEQWLELQLDAAKAQTGVPWTVEALFIEDPATQETYLARKAASGIVCHGPVLLPFLVPTVATN